MSQPQQDPGSFRDPSGFVFRDADGVLLRQLHASYESDYQRLMDSGLYARLTDEQMLTPHTEAAVERRFDERGTRVIAPEELPIVSYPYEWSFGALQEAALLTLRIQRIALEHDMTLKDASAYNVLFRGAWPVFIDTFSFEAYQEGKPWQAYNQFCRHFLAPLALMSKVDVSLGRMLAIHLDGIPLDVAAKLLPWRCRLSPGLVMHLFLHARMVHRYQDSSAGPPKEVQLSKKRQLGLIDSLYKTTRAMTYRPSGTEWADYYQNTSYSEQGFADKQEIVRRMAATAAPSVTWDLGANTGVFSQLAAEVSDEVVAWDVDAACVEQGFRSLRKRRIPSIQPLQLDLTNPSGPLGWAGRERRSFLERGPVDLVLALALIHHLAIANNVPLPKCAEFFASICRDLVIEFVPKDDPQVQRLLSSREDIFADYALEPFERAFFAHFRMLERQSVGADGRVMFHFTRRELPSR